MAVFLFFLFFFLFFYPLCVLRVTMVRGWNRVYQYLPTGSRDQESRSLGMGFGVISPCKTPKLKLASS